MTKSAHTPAPWRTDVALIYGADNHEIADCRSRCRQTANPELIEADAAFIVRAVNAHDALVEALDMCLADLQVLAPKDRTAGQIKGEAALSLAKDS